MKKPLGFVLLIGAVLCWGYFFFAPLSGEEREILARQADYGGVSALTPKPRSIFLYSGVALAALGSTLIKRS